MKPNQPKPVIIHTVPEDLTFEEFLLFLEQISKEVEQEDHQQSFAE